jgi:hypothetical protein
MARCFTLLEYRNCRTITRSTGRYGATQVGLSKEFFVFVSPSSASLMFDASRGLRNPFTVSFGLHDSGSKRVTGSKIRCASAHDSNRQATCAHQLSVLILVTRKFVGCHGRTSKHVCGMARCFTLLEYRNCRTITRSTGRYGATQVGLSKELFVFVSPAWPV